MKAPDKHHTGVGIFLAAPLSSGWNDYLGLRSCVRLGNEFSTNNDAAYAVGLVVAHSADAVWRLAIVVPLVVWMLVAQHLGVSDRTVLPMDPGDSCNISEADET